MSLTAKYYHFPGSHLKELPENILNWLMEDYEIDRATPSDDVPDRLKDHSLLIVENAGEIIFAQWDGGEPEDQTFGRDLSWVAGIIQKAYDLGMAAPGGR